MTPAQMQDNAKTAKFNINFMLMMLMSGRHDEATQACQKALAALTGIIGEDDA
jgi:hypothetical protein